MKAPQAEEAFAPGEITEETQPTIHCKCSANHQTDSSSCFKEKPTACLLPSVALPSHLQPGSASFLTSPHYSNERLNYGTLSLQQERDLRLTGDLRLTVFSPKKETNHFVSALIAGLFPCTCPSTAPSPLLPCWMVFSHHLDLPPGFLPSPHWTCL